MKYSMTLAALAATAYAAPQALQSRDECSSSYDGTFDVSIYTISAKRDLSKRSSCDGEGVLLLTLEGGILKDSKGRTGYIASNYQFQFDAPPQADAITASGWSTCSNGSLALDSSTQFYQCLSGDFYNLYNKSWAAQCEPVEIVAHSCGTTASASGEATQIGDGQVVGSGVNAPPVTQISDGQIQVPTSVAVAPPVTQITDGQPQAPTATAVATTAAPVVTEITDGQPQAPTATAVVSTILPVVTEITDGQPQAPTATAAVTTSALAIVTQITDGQPQAPTTAAPVPNNTTMAAVPTTTAVVPVGSGIKVIPGTTAALFIAAVGAFFCL